MSSHAYFHMVGRTVGIAANGGVVAASVMTPEIGQDDNYLNLMTADGYWHLVRWDEVYRADFINAVLPPGA